MKKINKNICFAALGIALLLPLGCKKGLLETKDQAALSEDALFKTPQDGISLVNSIYDGMQHNNQSFVLKALWYNANYTAQDFFNWGADVSYNTYQFPTTFGATNDFWNLSYQAIARANSAFPILAKMKADGILTADLAGRLTGEAYFLRGLYYYYLACTFGGVPLELKTVTDDGLHPRNTEAEVWASVASDMTIAAGLLPWTYDATDIGRATKGAALGYLGSADMWLGKDNNDNTKYTAAIAAFNQLDAHYSLESQFMNVHEYNNQNGKESLFEIQFQNPSGGKEDWNGGNEVNWNGSFGYPQEISTFGYTYGNKICYDSFEPGDNRKQATIIGPDDENTSPGIIAGLGGIKGYPSVISGFAAGNVLYIGNDGKIINTCGTTKHPWIGTGLPVRQPYYAMKTWRDPNVTGATTASDGVQHIFGDQNSILLRYAEILLSKAECQFKTGDVTGATATAMLVRNRAWGGTAPAFANKNGTDFMQNLLDEYHHELTGEYSLWYDLRRSGLHINYIKTRFNIDIPQGHDLFPIPQLAIASNSTLKQNPGY